MSSCFLFCFLVIMDIPAVRLLCLEQGNCFLEEHVEEFIDLTYQSTFPDNCLCSFLYASLNTTTMAQLSGEGPQGSLVELVEWVLASCGSLLTIGPIDNDASLTQNPVLRQNFSSCQEKQQVSISDTEPDSAAVCEPVPGVTEHDIGM